MSQDGLSDSHGPPGTIARYVNIHYEHTAWLNSINLSTFVEDEIDGKVCVFTSQKPHTFMVVSMDVLRVHLFKCAASRVFGVRAVNVNLSTLSRFEGGVRDYVQGVTKNNRIYLDLSFDADLRHKEISAAM